MVTEPLKRPSPPQFTLRSLLVVMTASSIPLRFFAIWAVLA